LIPRSQTLPELVMLRKSPLAMLCRTSVVTASLSRTFDVEIQFPSRGSRDVSRPFSFLSFCFFLACSLPAIRPFFQWILSRPGAVKHRDRRFLPLFPLARERVTRRAQRVNRRAYLPLRVNTLHSEITPILRKTVVAANSHAKILAK